MELTRRSAIAGALTLLSARDAHADLYDDYINSTSKLPFISFLARKSPNASGKPGHSFVAVGTDVDASLIFYHSIFGYYPSTIDAMTQIKAIFTRVKGVIKFDWADLTWDVAYKVRIDDPKRDAALAVVNKWNSSDPGYNLLANSGKNCSSFAAEIAQSIGLKVPSGAGSKLPLTYMTELRDLNK